MRRRAPSFIRARCGEARARPAFRGRAQRITPCYVLLPRPPLLSIQAKHDVELEILTLITSISFIYISMCFSRTSIFTKMFNCATNKKINYLS